MLSFSVHFLPFFNFNNKSDNTNFSYHFVISALFVPSYNYSCRHVIPTLSE